MKKAQEALPSWYGVVRKTTMPSWYGKQRLLYTLSWAVGFVQAPLYGRLNQVAINFLLRKPLSETWL
jgi:hypothetical protein